MKPFLFFYFFVFSLPFFNLCSGYSVNCKQSKVQVEKCTLEVHNFQKTHISIDGNQWLSPEVSKELNDKCHVAMNCLKLLGTCSVFDDDDILWLEDFCDSYQFFTSDRFYQCALKIDKNYVTPCVQHYLVNSPYFLLEPHERCNVLRDDGYCVKDVIRKTSQKYQCSGIPSMPFSIIQSLAIAVFLMVLYVYCVKVVVSLLKRCGSAKDKKDVHTIQML